MLESRRDVVSKMGDLAAEAGLERVAMLAWRDLEDPEAGGSEVHASTVASFWARAGIEVTMRTSFAPGSPQVSWRDGYRVIRKAGRYMVFPRAAFSEMMGWHGGRDGLVEIWNGMPFSSPVWARTPHVTWFHHVHAEMWNMTLPPRLAVAGRTLEARIAPKFYRRTPIVTLSDSSKRDLVEDLGFADRMVHVVPPGIDPRFTPGGVRSDRPLVVGCVYNNDNKYPWDLPANKTQSGIKSDSSKGHNGYNQLRFEDKKGQEQVEFHAERDLDSIILNKETRTIAERAVFGPGSPARDTKIVRGDDKLKVQMGHRDTTISMDDKLQVMMNKTSTIGMKRDATVGMNDTETVGMSQSVTVGMSQSTTIGMSDTITAGISLTVTCGATITLVAGASMISLGPAGVQIVAPSISLVGPVVAAPTIACPSIASPGFVGLINGHP